MILIDTDHLSVLLDPRDSKREPLIARLEATADEIAVPIPSLEEQLRAWLAQIRRSHDPRKQIGPYGRLGKLFEFMGEWPIARWDDAAATQFMHLRASGLRIGSQDLKIAAVAIASGALLLSANLRDFDQVPGLRVQDWIYGASKP